MADRGGTGAHDGHLHTTVLVIALESLAATT